jgi:peptidoglycan/LPS O-acetylase OafA/YrhL
MPGSIAEIALLASLAVVCYVVAVLTSHVCVRWLLRGRLKAEIANPTRYVGIDGIRGYLAFGVFVHHYIIYWLELRHGHSGSPPLSFENELGKGAVAIFFMITAFLFWDRVQTKRGLEAKSFFTSRFFRIYPLYLVFVVLLFVAVLYESSWTMLEPASSLAKEFAKWIFLHVVVINRHAGYVFGGVAWTLLYEAWFYLSLPLLVIIVFRKTALWKKALCLGIVAALFLVNHLQIWVCAAFLGGIFAVYWRLSDRRVKVAESSTASVIALICLACVGVFIYDPFNPLAITLLSVFFIVISSGNTLFGLLGMPSARWMGEISYSIYLVHGIVLWLFTEIIVPRVPGFHPSVLWLTAVGVLLTPILVLVTSASYLVIERPFISFGHRFSKSDAGAYRWRQILDRRQLPILEPQRGQSEVIK